MKPLILGTSFLAMTFLLPIYAMGQTIDLGTAGNAANWSITGAGATGSPAFQVSANGPGELSLTSNGFRNGTFVTGGSLANFNGFWYADESFSLPSNATNIHISFDSLYGNDRVVLQLNGTNIGNANYSGTTGTGVMSFPPGPPDVPYTFTGATSGTVTSGFNLGSINTVRLVVNNTGATPLTAPTSTFKSGNDATDVHVNITLSYSVVPAPPALLTALLGAIPGARLLTRRRRRK